MKKKFLIITGVMVLFASLAGFWGYNKYFKPDQEIQQQLNKQFGADFFNSFGDEKATNNSGAANSSGSANNAQSGDAKKNDVPTSVAVSETAKGQEEGKTATDSTSANGNVAAKQVTQDEINNKYTPKFNYLQNVALSRLDTLYSAAVQEYIQSSKAGTLDRSKLAQKYIQAGTMLEANVDSQFYSALNAMQAELVANNLPTDIISVNKSAYEKAKANKRAQLLAKVRK